MLVVMLDLVLDLVLHRVHAVAHVASPSVCRTCSPMPLSGEFAHEHVAVTLSRSFDHARGWALR